MERLTDQGGHADAADAHLADLLRNYRDGAPGLVPAGRKQALLRGVLGGRRSPGARRALLLRPAVALSVLLLAGATLAATAGHDFLARGLRRLTTGAPRDTTARAATGVREATPQPSVVPEAPPAVVAAPAPALPEAKVALPAPRAHASARASARAARSEDPSKVVAAIRALRSEHDPGRARSLLSAYLQQYPNGALSEEALALSIEAATALHDTSAATFATRYLRAYPQGRFRRTAEQALHLP